MAAEVTLISKAEFGRHPFQSNVLSEKFARPGDAGTELIGVRWQAVC